MKCSQRLFCVFSVFVLLFGAFSITATAESSIQHNFQVGLNSSWGNDPQPYVHVTGDNTQIEYSRVEEVLNENTIFYPFVNVAPSDGTPLAKKGKETVIQVNNVWWYFQGVDSNGALRTFPIHAFDDGAYCYIEYTDGTTGYAIPQYSYNANTECISFELTLTPTKDIRKISFRGDHTPYNLRGSWIRGLKVKYHGISAKKINAIVTQQSEEAGLLGGLLQWVKDIFNKIGDTFTEIKNGFSNIGKWLAELPAKIWEFIENGLKALFVPSEEYMSSFKDKFDTLLENKLGAVYQVVSITLDSWDSIKDADAQNIIKFPQSAITFNDGTTFRFGNYNVEIVPPKFAGIATTVKTIVGIVCTILFINGLRKRYDEIMGVET